MTEQNELDLEVMFDVARAAPPQMSVDLAERLVADALALQRPAPLWQRILAALGGPAGLGGLVTATVAGFWLGVAPPDIRIDLFILFGAEELQGEDMTGLYGFGWDSEEG